MSWRALQAHRMWDGVSTAPQRLQAELEALPILYERRPHGKTPPSSWSIRRCSLAGSICFAECRYLWPLPSARNDS
eukprot:1300162-Rhodomonas_salina.1